MTLAVSGMLFIAKCVTVTVILHTVCH